MVTSTSQHSPASIDPDWDNVITAKKAAELLGLRLSSVYALTSARQVPHIKFRGRLLFDKTELLRWVQSHRRVVIDELSANEHINDTRKSVR